MTSFKNLTLDTGKFSIDFVVDSTCDWGGVHIGVARFNFPLSSEPVLGQYALCATLEVRRLPYVFSRANITLLRINRV